MQHHTSPATTANAIASNDSSTVVIAPRKRSGRYFRHSRMVEMRFRTSDDLGLVILERVLPLVPDPVLR